MSTASGEPEEEDARVEAHLARLGERVRDQMLQEGAAQMDERARLSARESLRRVMDGERRRAGRRRPWAIAGLGAAAALVAFVLWMRRDTAPSAGGGGPLGTPNVRALQPRDKVRDFERFEWEGELPAGGTFELVIRDPSHPEKPIVDTRLHETYWVPSPAQRSAFPRELQWEVRVLDALQTVQAANGATAVRDARQ